MPLVFMSEMSCAILTSRFLFLLSNGRIFNDGIEIGLSPVNIIMTTGDVGRREVRDLTRWRLDEVRK